ncbi:MAG: cytochrome c3 family protein, partial [Gemmatimonadales bacterium]
TCVGCHAPGRTHLTQGDSACGHCHVTLAVSSLASSDVAGFPAPPSHQDSAFALGGGHGRVAMASAVSCAFCHAQEFCATCHANAAAVPAIAGLASDLRSLAIGVRVARPPSHLQPDFQRVHGTLSRQTGATCATCHSQESCTTCHQGNVPAPVQALGRATMERPTGVTLVRHPPASHADPTWKRSHGTAAAARPQTCYGCHAQAQCLSCHRPSAGATGDYHHAGFLARHPAEAYARESSCAECHNTGGVCQDCPRTAGVTASGPLKAGFHDAQGAFLLSHGQAARQGLETCVSCHAERDCLTCHSATGGRGFDPHGPGFNAAQLRAKNPTMCVACHGNNIPTH